MKSYVEIRHTIETGNNKVIEVEAGTPIIDILKSEFKEPIKSKVNYKLNGEDFDIKYAGYKLKEGDVFIIDLRPGIFGTLAIVAISLIAAISAITYILRLMAPKVDDGKTVNNTSDITTMNINKGGGVGFGFGTFKLAPDLIEEPVKINNLKYKNGDELKDLKNEATTYYLACLGLGKYNINNIYYGDTKIEDLTDTDGNPLIRYKKINGEELKNLDNISGFEGFSINLIKNNDISNLTFKSPGQKTKVVLSKRKYGKSSKFYVNISFMSGLYRINSRGSKRNQDQVIKITLREIDEYDKETSSSPITFTYTLATKEDHTFNLILSEDIPLGRYNIEIERASQQATENNRFLDFTVESIYSYNDNFKDEFKSEVLKDIELVLFKVKSDVAFSSNTENRLNLSLTRDGISTIDDFIYDMWTNKYYGCNEDIDMLDVRLENSDAFNCYMYLKEKNSSLSLLKKALNTKFLDIYPSRGKFVIRKDTEKLYSHLMITSKNSIDTVITKSIYKDDNDGVIVSYIEPLSLDKIEFKYPLNSINPVKIETYGIESLEEANKVAKYQYKKMFGTEYQAKTKLSLEGLIPELYNRVSLQTELEKDMQNYSILDITDGGNSLFINLSDTINYDSNKVYNVYAFEVMDTNRKTVGKALSYDDVNNILEVSKDGYIPSPGDIGYISDMGYDTKDYIVIGIDYNRKESKVELSLKEYNPDIYVE